MDSFNSVVILVSFGFARQTYPPIRPVHHMSWKQFFWVIVEFYTLVFISKMFSQPLNESFYLSISNRLVDELFGIKSIALVYQLLLIYVFNVGQ